jgi:hypothetical protein
VGKKGVGSTTLYSYITKKQNKEKRAKEKGAEERRC